ncbi:MAG: hypothetical protein WCG01_00080 [bacterium]
MNTISDKVLNKIKTEKIAPKPRWQFQLRDSGRWLGFSLLIVIATASVGLLMYFWSDGPWLHGGRFGFGLLFGRMPLILISLFILGALFALYDFRNTGRGYRLSIKSVSLVLIAMAILFGWLFYYLGLSQDLDSVISKAPYYQDRQMYMMQVWQNPSNGLIAGQISKIVNEQSFYLKDFAGKEWLVDASGALWRHNLIPEIGLEIKLIGTANGNNFKTDEVRPLIGNGNCAMMQNPVGAGSCGMMR